MGVQEPDLGHLRLQSVSSYDGAPRVRHVDQLSVAEYDRLLELLSSNPDPSPQIDGAFQDGEIIIYTDYYQVRRTHPKPFSPHRPDSRS